MLPSYKNILVPTDLSPNSDYAFKHAITISRQSSAKIHLLHVIPEINPSMRIYLTPVNGDSNQTELEQKNLKEAKIVIRKNLNDFVKNELEKSPDDLARFAGVEVCVGHPSVEILAAANKLNADLIIMGTHGKGTLEHAFLGSIAEKVLHRTDKPVLVVPLPK